MDMSYCKQQPALATMFGLRSRTLCVQRCRCTKGILVTCNEDDRAKVAPGEPPKEDELMGALVKHAYHSSRATERFPG
jgi:hypothetical protein